MPHETGGELEAGWTQGCRSLAGMAGWPGGDGAEVSLVGRGGQGPPSRGGGQDTTPREPGLGGRHSCPRACSTLGSGSPGVSVRKQYPLWGSGTLGSLGMAEQVEEAAGWSGIRARPQEHRAAPWESTSGVRTCGGSAQAKRGAEHRRAELARAGCPPGHTRDSRCVQCVPSRPDSRAPLWAHCPPQSPRHRASRSWVLAERVGPRKTVG